MAKIELPIDKAMNINQHVIKDINIDQQKVGDCSEPGRTKGGNVGVILPSSAGPWRLRYGSLGIPSLVSRIVFSPCNLVSCMLCVIVPVI